VGPTRYFIRNARAAAAAVLLSRKGKNRFDNAGPAIAFPPRRVARKRFFFFYFFLPFFFTRYVCLTRAFLRRISVRSIVFAVVKFVARQRLRATVYERLRNT